MGLREERGVATWNFGNRPSICLKRQEKVLLQQIMFPVKIELVPRSKHISSRLLTSNVRVPAWDNRIIVLGVCAEN